MASAETTANTNLPIRDTNILVEEDASSNTGNEEEQELVTSAQVQVDSAAAQQQQRPQDANAIAFFVEMLHVIFADWRCSSQNLIYMFNLSCCLSSTACLALIHLLVYLIVVYVIRNSTISATSQAISATNLFILFLISFCIFANFFRILYAKVARYCVQFAPEQQEANHVLPMWITQNLSQISNDSVRQNMIRRMQLAMTDRDFRPEDYEDLLELDNENVSFRGASDNEIARLPSLRIPTNDDKDAQHNNCSATLAQKMLAKKCSICLCEYEKGEIFTTLPCLHKFHKDCVTNWLSRKATCPVCLHELVLQ